MDRDIGKAGVRWIGTRSLTSL